MVVVIPPEVAEQFDEDLSAFVEDPRLDVDEDEASSSEIRTTATASSVLDGEHDPRDELPEDADDAPRVKPMVPLSPADPFLFTHNSLRNLWEEAMDVQSNSPRPVVLHRSIPVGPYELAVIPTGRGRSAVRAVLQGMQAGKQIEMFTPLANGRDAGSRAVIAVWIYQDSSMAVVHLNFQNKERYVLWDARDAHQFNYENIEELRIRLSVMNLEVPDQLDRVLSRK